jgi:hypothetical protein
MPFIPPWVAWIDWSDYLRLIGVTGRSFLSMTSATAHSGWPQRQPSWIWFPSIIWRAPESTRGRSLSKTRGVTHPRWLLWRPYWKHKNCYYSWTNGLIESQLCVDLVRIHDIIPGFFIWPTFQCHIGQSSIRISKLARSVTAGPG